MIKKINTRRILYWIFTLTLLYLLLISGGKYFQTLSTFPAIVYNVQEFTGYVKEDLNFEEINIKTISGENINGLYIDNSSDKTVYYFHGNGGPLSFFYSEIRFIRDLGYNVMAYDYPGYGKSTGTPHSLKLTEFSYTFFDYIKKEKNLKNDDIIVWGYSVGTGVATDFASKNNFDKLVLVSPLASRYDMAKEMFGFTIQKLLFIPNSLNTKELIKNIKNPTLIIHGNKDKIVPFKQGKLVFDNSISNKKYFIELNNWGHNYIINSYGKNLKKTIKSFLEGFDLKGNYLFIDENKKERLFKESLVFDSDLTSDSSITKFVNNKVSFTDISYAPENLESISSDFIYDAKGGSQKLQLKAKISLENMGKDFFKHFKKKIVVISAYRSYLYQKSIKDKGCPDNLCAKAGFSEHQSGLAIDLREASTKDKFFGVKHLKDYYEWLSKNAHKYGFANTYIKGIDIDGYEVEPWHWRYLGEQLATYLHKNNITIAEFYEIVGKVQ